MMVPPPSEISNMMPAAGNIEAAISVKSLSGSFFPTDIVKCPASHDRHPVNLMTAVVSNVFPAAFFVFFPASAGAWFVSADFSLGYLYLFDSTFTLGGDRRGP